ncbi:MAG: YciI family protein [Caulobacteraceae bacterium]
MQYMLLIHTDEARMKEAMASGRPPEMMGAYRAYTEAMQKAGAFVAGDALQPSSTATVVRVRDGKTQVLDGPYAEAKEQLAGYYLIEAKDLDTALEWAARCPGAAWGTMEVRPVMVFAPATATA